MKKKIIFIGGTSRSGSTLLDLILSNDSKAKSLGEIHALFRPTRKHHFKEIEKLKKTSDNWAKIISNGKSHLYNNLHQFYPHIETFIDSSKDPFWFRYHQKLNKDQFNYKNVLIYKTPAELASSFIKRGNCSSWEKQYISYHKKYFSLISEFYLISYKNLVTNSDSLKTLCDFLEIEYFDGKIRYWENQGCPFFGSSTTKKDKSFNNDKVLKETTRKDITYESPTKNIIEFVKNRINEEPEILKIFNFLKSEGNPKRNINPIFKYNNVRIFITRLKIFMKRFYLYYFPEDYFKR